MRKVQKLSADKLTEVDNLLSKIENQFKSEEKTLKLTGSWKDLNEDPFIDLIEKLHSNRANDRQIN
jgi:mRNA-degrading endonuclease YafQ of YafQ-DinJ toxin-antitoxin module